MSLIDDFIAQFCPDGVDSYELGEVAGYSDTRVVAATVDEETFVGVDNLLPNQAGRTYSTYVPTTGNLTSYQQGDILIGNIRPYLKKIWLATNVGGCSGDVLAVRINETYKPILMPEFLYRILSSEAFFTFNMQHAKGAKMPRGSKTMILKYRIPVPPFEVQREIVKVLDIFTKLEAELEAELEARRRQYKYYRDALLAFKDQNIQWVTMAEIGKFIRGRRFTKADYVEAGVGCIHYGEIYTHYGISANEVISQVRPEMKATLRFAKPGDVVITDVGETVEDVGKAVAWIGTEDVAIHDHCYAFRHSMNPKFVSYCMQTTSFIAEKAKYVARTKVNTLLIDGFSKIRIPVPPREEQERIVAILDKLDTLVNDLSIGLPAEIKARRQQYEHYRDRLLSFREVA